MYMPGRSRTGSRPSRTVMSFAEYVVSVIKKALLNQLLRAEASVSVAAAGGGSCEALRGGPRDEVAELRILDHGSRLRGLRALLRRGYRRRRSDRLRVGRGRLGERPGSEAQGRRCGGPEL